MTSYIKHEQILVQQSQDFQARLKHPPDTIEIKHHRQVGLVGNGNNCSYFVETIRQFSGNLAKWAIAPPDTTQQWYLVYELDVDLNFEDDFDMRCT